MYIVVNEDLEMGKGKVSAQVAHACTCYLLQSGEKEKIDKWFNQCQKKIVLRAHQKQMEKFEEQFPQFAVRDLGLTEIPENSLTAVCLGIGTKENMLSIVKRLRIYK
jgi:PTH2 family peptidyl-tRNA hydrolase